jgi:hypothetical protein
LLGRRAAAARRLEPDQSIRRRRSVVTLLLGLVSVDAAPRLGLGIGAVVTLVAGIVSAVRVEPLTAAIQRVVPAAPECSKPVRLAKEGV